jgi:hypothetical protein
MTLRRLLLVVLLAAVLAAVALSTSACGNDGQGPDESSTTEAGGAPSGDVDGSVGDVIKVAKAVISCRTLDATFNPITPPRRMSEQTPSAPSGDESFYQAFVKVENKGTAPLRVDPDDFVCVVGNSVVGVDPTWSGPAARSLLKNSSIELLVTFKGKAGYQPVLVYSPSWYDGTIRIKASASISTTSTAEG